MCDLVDSCLEPGGRWCVVFVCAEQVSILWLAGSSVCGVGLWLLLHRVLCVICCCLCIRWLPIRSCHEVWPCTRICVGCTLIVLFVAGYVYACRFCVGGFGSMSWLWAAVDFVVEFVGRTIPPRGRGG